jgi:hypothetical protein
MNDYAVDAYVADQDLEGVLNERDRQGYVIWRMFRNEPSRGGTENTTIIWKTIMRVVADTESTYPLERDAAPYPIAPGQKFTQTKYNDQW